MEFSITEWTNKQTNKLEITLRRRTMPRNMKKTISVFLDQSHFQLEDIMRLKLLGLWIALASVKETVAFPVKGSKIRCDVPSVMVGQPTLLTCDYKQDLKEKHTDFVVKQRNQGGNRSEILSCLWHSADRPTCKVQAGYVMDWEHSTTVKLKIPSATEQHVGSYVCLTIGLPSDEHNSETCNFTLKDPSEATNQTSTLAPATVSGEGNASITKGNEDGGNTSTVVIVIPVILTMLVLICAAVIIFKYWGRITERCGKDTTDEGRKRKVSAHYVTKEPELLSQTTSGNEEIKRALSKDDVDPASEQLLSSGESNATQTQSTIEQPHEVVSPDGASDSNPLNAREDTGKPLQTGSSQDQTFTQPNDVKEKEEVKLPDSYLYNRALGLLKRTGAVIITGTDGEKYVFGRMLVQHFAKWGFSPLELDHPNLWWDKRKGDRRHIVLLNELKADVWLNTALKSMLQDDQCYVILMIRSDTRNTESGLPSFLQTVPTVDLGQTLTPETKGAKQLLREACQKDDLEQVVTLLSAGFSPQWVDKGNKTALHIACERGNATIVENLMWAGSFVNARDKKWRTPLYCACSSRSEIIPAVQLDSKQTTTASNKVIEHGKDLRQNSVQNVTNEGEDSFSFPESSESPRETIVKCLLASGADPKATDIEGRTPLHVACEHSNCTVVAMLHSVGADVNAVDKAGRTPLHVACEHDNCPSVTMLLKFSADVNAKEKTGCTPLHVACTHANYDVVRSLLYAGADVNATDKTDRTPLHVASQHNDGKIVQALICAQSDVDAREKNKCTALHLACLESAWDSVEILLKADASVEAKTKFGMTPLHIACSRGNKEIVVMLLKKNADIHVKDVRNDTPRDLAESEGHKELARILMTAENESRV